MSDANYREVLSALSASSSPVLIVCHISPDGDAIGAALAISQFCESRGLQTVLVNDDPIPVRYNFLPGTARFQRTKDTQGRFETVIAVDCADWKRMGTAVDLFADTATVINIDHHDTNCGFGQINVVESEAAATCLVLYRIFQAAAFELSNDMALMLYSGIVFDTGGFRYNNTTPEIHEAAAALLRKGIEPFTVADRLLESITREQAELVRLGLATLTVMPGARVAYVAVNQEMLKQSGADDEDTDVLLPYARSMQGIEVGILFRERSDGSVKVSMRSREKVDVAAIALSFSGGGHVRAAGCTLTGPLQSAVERLMATVMPIVDGTFVI